MKIIDKKIVEKILDEFLEKISFPFSWGKEALRFLYYFQKGEEKDLLKSFEEIKNFQAWINKNQNILDMFIKMLNEIKDIRVFMLIEDRKSQENEKNIIYLWENIKNLIKKNKIPLSSELLIFPDKEIGIKNFIWEILSWYLKVSKFITFSINFNYFPKLNSDFIFKGEKIYQSNKYYLLEEEESFLKNLLINLSGFPSREGIKEFSLPHRIFIKKSTNEYFSLDSKNFNLIFYLS